MKIKRYLLMMGEAYYPEGYQDIQDTFDSVEEAVKIANLLFKGNPWGMDWAEVIDLSTPVSLAANADRFFKRDEGSKDPVKWRYYNSEKSE